MTVLENEVFLHELTKFCQRSRSSGNVVVTMKRYDGRTKPYPRDQKTPATPLEYKCLFRARFGNHRISTVVNAKDVNKFQLAYFGVLKANMDSLRKRDRKSEKDRKTTKVAA